jgi:hypothetical protein
MTRQQVRPWRLIPALLCITLLGSNCTLWKGKSENGGWISLFNGRDLSGWQVKIASHDLGDNYKDTFRVEDGLLKVCYDQYEQFDEKFGHIFYQTPYSHYRIRLEYRFLSEQVPGGPGWAFRNNGIMVHCQSPESMGRDQNFPDSIEVQLLGGNGKDERPTGNLCTPGTHVVINGELVTRHVTDSCSKTYHGDQWVRVEVEVIGQEKIRHFIEGELVLEYDKPQLDNGTPLGGGYIALQAESHPIEFRRIELLPLQ